MAVKGTKVEVALDPSGAQEYDIRESVSNGFRTVVIGKKGRNYPVILGVSIVRDMARKCDK